MSMSISILLSILVFILCLSSNCGRRTIPTKDNHDDGNGDRFVRVHKDAGNAVELLRKLGAVTAVAATANKVRVTKIIRTRCFWFGSSLVECRFVSFRFGVFVFGDSCKRYRNQADHNISTVHIRRGFIFHSGTSTETQFNNQNSI